MCGVRYLLSTGKRVDHEMAPLNPPTCLRAFWLKPLSLFGLCSVTVVTQIHLGLPYPLPSHSPVEATRREGSSRSPPRMLSHASVHCQGRSLFRPLGSPGGTGGPHQTTTRTTHEATSGRNNGFAAQRSESEAFRSAAAAGLAGFYAATSVGPWRFSEAVLFP